MSPDSDSTWTISPSSLKFIKNVFNNTYNNNNQSIYLNLQILFTRKDSLKDKNQPKFFDFPLYDKSLNINKTDVIGNFMHMINKDCSTPIKNVLLLRSFYNPVNIIYF